MYICQVANKNANRVRKHVAQDGNSACLNVSIDRQPWQIMGVNSPDMLDRLLASADVTDVILRVPKANGKGNRDCWLKRCAGVL